MGKAEHYVEGYLETQAEKHGFLCYKFVSPSRKGMPDRILIGQGETIFVECKSDIGQLSKIQTLIIKRMRQHGAHVEVLSTREKIDEFFSSYTKGG